MFILYREMYFNRVNIQILLYEFTEEAAIKFQNNKFKYVQQKDEVDCWAILAKSAILVIL